MAIVQIIKNIRTQNRTLILLENSPRSAGNDRNLLIDMNDSAFTFDEIADYLDRIGFKRFQLYVIIVIIVRNISFTIVKSIVN